MINQGDHIDDAKLLNEILPLPSQQKIIRRFFTDNLIESADCSGRCASGVCRPFV